MIGEVSGSQSEIARHAGSFMELDSILVKKTPDPLVFGVFLIIS